MSTPNSKSLLAIGLLTAVSRAVTVVPDVTSLRSSLQNQQAFLVEMDIAYFKEYSSLILPGCIANSTEYEAALAAANCGACSSSGTADVRDVCCDGLSEWSSSNDACRSYKGEDSLVCCNLCTNVSNVGYSQQCDMSNDGENLVGASVCNVDTLVVDTDPLPAGYECSTSPDHTIGGTYSENDIDYSMPSCDSFDTALVSYSTLGTAAMEDWTATADAIQMREELGIVYRAQLANGRITFDSTMKCGIITNPIANGALIIEDGENSDMRILNPYVYASSPAAVLNGTRMVVMGGDNNGVMDFNNAATVHLMGIVNSGAVSFQTISDLVVLDVENKAGAMISFINNQARLDAVTNYGDVTVFSGVVNATEIYNHGTILVKSGSKGMLELYENTGSVIFEDNVDAEVYAPSTVGITLPSDGSITVTIGKADGTDFDEDMFMPVVVEFGDLTTIAARRNKFEWMTPSAAVCPGAEVKGFNILSLKSIIQSPSEERMNLVIDVQHLHTSVAINREHTFLKLSILRSDGYEVFSKDQNLFDETAMLTHFTPPVNNMDNAVNMVLKVGIQVDFVKHEISPLDMSHSVIVEIGVMDAAGTNMNRVYDCVKVNNSGVAGFA